MRRSGVTPRLSVPSYMFRNTRYQSYFSAAPVFMGHVGPWMMLGVNTLYYISIYIPPPCISQSPSYPVL